MHYGLVLIWKDRMPERRESHEDATMTHWRTSARCHKRIRVLLLFLLSPWASAARAVLIEHVNVVDVRASAIHFDQTVVIRGERIERVRKAAPTKGTKRIDGRGKYLIPGLWDMHVHLGAINRDSFQIYLANGIIGLREMASSPAEFSRLKLYRTDVASGKTVGPQLVATAEGIEGPNSGKVPPFGAQDATDARTAVDLLRKIGADFVTVGGDVSREAYFSLAEECRRHKFPFSGHVPRDLTAEEVSDSGQSSIEHMDGLLLACSSAESQLRDSMRQGRAISIETILETFDPNKASLVAARLRKNRTWLCPTLTEQRFLAEANDPGLYRDPRLRYVRLDHLREWESRLQSARNNQLAGKLFQANLRVTGLMWRSGVRILAGTDTPWPYCIPGFALHDELELLVRAGLSPAAALGAATIGPAEFLGRTPSAGEIQPGAFADLLLLDGNPLTDIGNTKRIFLVVIRGHVLARRDLDRILDRVAARAAAGR
jgi:hypothetical protein